MQLERDRHDPLPASPAARPSGRPAALGRPAVVGMQFLGFLIVAALLVDVAREPSTASVLLFGLGTLAYALTSFGLDRPRS